MSKIKKHKYIFVCGGVMSGVGKGITTSSIALILKSKGFKVNPIKIDPYLNVDAGTMNPGEHGEVFVLESGLECDQDMGNYERFLGCALPRENYMTNGMVLKHVIDKERALGYGGKCVEPMYHVTEEVIRRIEVSRELTKSDISIIEIGGTVGEYQNSLFIEAARLVKIKHSGDVAFVMVSYLPIPSVIGEMKTKPTQAAIRTLNSHGVHPDIIIGRSSKPIDQKRKEKIAEASGIPVEHIISAPDIESIYEVPLNFEKDDLGNTLLTILGVKYRASKKRNLNEWRTMFNRMKNATTPVNIGIVGKYFKTGDFVLRDVYISIIESLKHAAGVVGAKINIDWIDSTDFEEGGDGSLSDLAKYNGILIPGGFGGRGVEGKIKTIQYLRENKIPFFGICYGMQLAVIEYARNILELSGANTKEVDKSTPYPVIDIMPEQIKNLDSKQYGGTMRLGVYKAVLEPRTLAQRLYNQGIIKERHRHRYEVNPTYIEQLEKSGLIFPGKSPNGQLMELIELPQDVHPFFIGTQFHPEFTGNPIKPHPLFVGFVKAAKDRGLQKDK
ncbi:MAG: CTP synthase [Candidatus Vogelbacteria bacterium]|nr:CTP synthase [Candidatus Vogelbacteria bacterium]